MLTDGFGRTVTNLRISVTDRCNLRCVYCMPAEPEWMPQPEILTFEEIGRIVRVAVSLGITDFRITGGEPTARRNLPDLVRLVASTPGVKDLAMTTNGILLPRLAKPLRDAGVVVVGLVTQVRDGTTLVCHASYAVMRELVDFLVAECCSESAASGDTKSAA